MTIIIDMTEIIPNAILNNLKVDVEELERFYTNSISRLDNDYEEVVKITQHIIVHSGGSLEPLSLEQVEKLQELNKNFGVYKRSKSNRSHLLIVGLYMMIEKSIKELIGGIKGITNNQLKNLHRLDGMKELLNEKFEISVEEIKNFKYFNELRVLNNCIKHSGIVDSELTEINPVSWNQDQEIGNVYDDFKRLSTQSIEFCQELFEKIKIKLKILDSKVERINVERN